MNPILRYIKASALTWWAYKKWECGDHHIRAHYMKTNMKDIVLAGTFYRLERRRKAGISKDD